MKYATLFFFVFILFEFQVVRADDKTAEALKEFGKITSTPQTISCDPVEVRVFGSVRFHVKCSSGAGNIVYFAAPLNDAAATASLNLILAAFTSKKTVGIEYVVADISGPSYGCLMADCRPIHSVWILKD